MSLQNTFPSRCSTANGHQRPQCNRTANWKDVQQYSWRYYAPPVYPRSFLKRRAKLERGAGQNAYLGIANGIRLVLEHTPSIEFRPNLMRPHPALASYHHVVSSLAAATCDSSSLRRVRRAVKLFKTELLSPAKLNMHRTPLSPLRSDSKRCNGFVLENWWWAYRGRPSHSVP